MGLESSVTYISDLNPAWPENDTDVVGQGDDHLRNIKAAALNTWPNVTGAVTLTHTQMNNAAIKDEVALFTANVLGVTGAAPELRMIETDASADNGAWIMSATGESLVLRAYNDALGSSDNVMVVQRTGVTIDTIRLGNNFQVNDSAAQVELNAGQAFRMYESDGSTSMRITHDSNSTDFLLSGTGLAHTMSFSGWNQMDVLGGMHLRVRSGSLYVGNSALSAYVQQTHDGANLDWVCVGTTNWNISGLDNAGWMQLEDGAAFRAFDQTNTDYIGFGDTGSQAQILTNNNPIHFYPGLTETVRMETSRTNLMGGNVLRIRDSGNTDYLELYQDGTDGHILSTNANWLRLRGNTTGILIDGGQRLRLYGAGGSNYIETRHDDTNGRITVSGGNLEIDQPVSSPNADAQEVGYKGAPKNLQNGNYTLALDDAGNCIRKESGSGGETYTIPANASVAFPIGTIIVIENDGGGDLTIAITTDTLEEWGTGSTGSRTLPDNNKAVIEKATATLWKYSATG